MGFFCHNFQNMNWQAVHVQICPVKPPTWHHFETGTNLWQLWRSLIFIRCILIRASINSVACLLNKWYHQIHRKITVLVLNSQISCMAHRSSILHELWGLNLEESHGRIKGLKSFILRCWLWVDFCSRFSPLWRRLRLHWPYKNSQIALVSSTTPVTGTPESHSMYGNVTPPAALW